MILADSVTGNHIHGVYSTNSRIFEMAFYDAEHRRPVCASGNSGWTTPGLKSRLLADSVQAKVTYFYCNYEGLQIGKMADQTSIN